MERHENETKIMHTKEQRKLKYIERVIADISQ